MFDQVALVSKSKSASCKGRVSSGKSVSKPDGLGGSIGLAHSCGLTRSLEIHLKATVVSYLELSDNKTRGQESAPKGQTGAYIRSCRATNGPSCGDVTRIGCGDVTHIGHGPSCGDVTHIGHGPSCGDDTRIGHAGWIGARN